MPRRRGTRLVEEIANDLRYGVRVLRKSPVFTSVAVLSLSLGIGANSAIFSLVDRLVLRRLPIHEPEQVVVIEGGAWTNPIWEQIRDRQHELFNGAIAWSDDHVQFDLAQGGTADLVDGLWVSGDFFSVLGVPPFLGRVLVASDDRRGGGPEAAVAVISYRFWQRRFGGAVDVVGRALTLDRVPYTIVGVTPPGFFGPSVGRSFDVAIPIASDPLMRGANSWLDKRWTWWLEIAARLKPGQSLTGATNALRLAQPQIREATLPPGWPPEEQRRYLRQGLTLVPVATGPSGLRLRYQQPLLALMGVVGLLLLLACANLANLLLARADGRQHELTLRLTLGASRARLARQLLTESLLLAGLGAALGLGFARWGSALLLRQLSVPGSSVFLDLSLDWRVLGFTASVAVGAALLFGVAPAFRSRRADPNETLKQHGTRGLAGEGRRALSGPLVVVQVALSLTLVVSAGLFVRTFSILAGKNIGFDRRPVLIVNLDAPRSALDKPPGRVRPRPGGGAQRSRGGSRHDVLHVRPVSGGWLEDSLRVSGEDGPVGARPLELGERREPRLVLDVRDGAPRRAASSTRAIAPVRPRVAIVNQAFAKRFLGEGSPIGRLIRQQGRPGRPEPAIEVVGLAEDAAYRSVREPLDYPTVLLPMAQVDDDIASSASISLRAASVAPALLTKDVATALHAVDPNLSLTFRPLADQVDASLSQERIVAMLSGFFGALAILLAGIGLYGVAAYA